ncbi:efflux RND transporter periplasmic adaptor subunit [Hymenobacter properus]|uniref:HlyD family efflux transporter periplasmic adaptor subunit n=1 Tax=Hymenobacter properus TaxID=2791026 RepID=A0A931BCY7_9BACT|nr:HlyD family efflux transporter periplasmic adaptor subunit [Hymenobacter properus]MBF9141019.1 HlyD family efflux transporter periplasmic adaptor subunit [Hymenobacter properus]MBR7719828.1 HlyD family efflux transporter periplasmic adaptor subunit [Microvirga sp. SRT04]
MDELIQKKTWTPAKLLLLGALALVVVAVAALLLTSAGPAKLNIDPERITISTVSRGPFQEFVPVDGVVMPIKTIYLDAPEGGTVQRILVEDGAALQAGQPIIQLANTDLQLEMVNRETAVFDLMNNLHNTRNLLQQNRITQLNQQAEIDNQLREAKRLYDLNKSLYDQKVIARQEYQQTKNAYDFQRRRKQLSGQALQHDSLVIREQINQMQQSVGRMQSNLALMRRKLDDLTIRAPAAGRITSLNAEIGELKTRGQRIGQLDMLTGLKVRATVDQYYISRIFPGQKGDITLNGKVYGLSVKKIFSQVAKGVQVDLEFTGETPAGLAQGQSLPVRLALSDQTMALRVPKGGFNQKTGGNWIFKVSENGDKAYKADIRLGRQNPDYYEVLEGLKPGDRVITSSYEGYENMGELELRAKSN